MKSPRIISVHEINQIDELPKDVQVHYSGMKYGVRESMLFCANATANTIKQDPKLIEAIAESRLLVASSGYNEVPNPASITSSNIVRLLGLNIEQHFVKILELGNNQMQGFFSGMSREQRAKEIKKTTLSISTALQAKVRGKVLLIFDDMRAAGTHEQHLREFLKTIEGIEQVVFAYFVKFGEHLGKNQPEAEAIINHSAIGSVLDLLPIIDKSEEDLVLNNRVIRTILAINDDHQKAKDLKIFLSKASPRLILEIYQAAVSRNNYQNIERYKAGFQILKEYALDLFPEKLLEKLSADYRVNHLHKEKPNPPKIPHLNSSPLLFDEKILIAT